MQQTTRTFDSHLCRLLASLLAIAQLPQRCLRTPLLPSCKRLVFLNLCHLLCPRSGHHREICMEQTIFMTRQATRQSTMGSTHLFLLWSGVNEHRGSSAESRLLNRQGHRKECQKGSRKLIGQNEGGPRLKEGRRIQDDFFGGSVRGLSVFLTLYP